MAIIYRSARHTYSRYWPETAIYRSTSERTFELGCEGIRGGHFVKIEVSGCRVHNAGFLQP